MAQWQSNELLTRGLKVRILPDQRRPQNPSYGKVIMKNSITPNKFVSIALEILKEHYKMDPNMPYHPQDIAANIGCVIYTMGESMGVILSQEIEKEAIKNNLFDYIDNSNSFTEEAYNRIYRKEYYQPELPPEY